MAALTLEPLPPEEAVAAFRQKGLLPSYAWQDVFGAEHAASFTVAKALRLDILEDLRGAVDDALAKGTNFQDFKKSLIPTLQAKGWWGRRTMTDPVTGRTETVQLGSVRRLEIIFDTNLRSSYAAGRWAQIQRVKAERPYLRYVAILDGRTRPLHRAWHGTVLPADDAFWATHFPPNGWRCRCSVQQLGDRDLRRFGYAVSPGPPKGSEATTPWRNPRTGDVVDVPVGIDPGFGHNAGAAARGVSRAAARLAERAGQQPPRLAIAAMPSEPAEREGHRAAWRQWVDGISAGKESRVATARFFGERVTVGALPERVLDALAATGRDLPQTGGVTVKGTAFNHGQRDSKRKREASAPLERVRELIDILHRPQTAVIDRSDNTLILGYDLGGPDILKVVIRMDRRGDRKATVNEIITTGLVRGSALADRALYDPLF